MSSPITLSQKAFSGAPVREKELRHLIESIRRNRCCAVVAPSNMGKSKLLHSLKTAEVQALIGQDAERPVMTVFVDCVALRSEIEFYQVLMGSILLELEEMDGIESESIKRFHSSVENVLKSATDTVARFYFTFGLRRFLERTDIKLVLILDEFETIFAEMHAHALGGFIALRDEFPKRVICILGVTRRLESIRADRDTFEFREPFRMNTLILRPLGKRDAIRFLQYQAGKMDATIDEQHLNRIITLAGGHPGMMDRILQLVIANDLDIQSPEAENILCEDIRLTDECERLWDELSEDEQRVLLNLVSGQPLTDMDALNYLLSAGILRHKDEAKEHSGSYCIFSPIFVEFIWRKLQWLGDLRLDTHDIEDVRIIKDNIDITNELSKTERELIRFMLASPGKILSVKDIGKAIWEWDYTPERVRQLIKSARDKIEPNPSRPIFIINKPRKGYLIQPNPGLANLRDSIDLKCREHDTG